MQQKHGRAEECGYGLLVKGQQGKMGTRNCINVAEKNTLSETGEGNVGLDLPRDAFLLSCHSPAYKE